MPESQMYSRPGKLAPVPLGVPTRTLLGQGFAGVLGFTLLLISFAAQYVVLVRPRIMEFDQICTLLTAQARSWHDYIAAVPADSQPPFSHIAARIGLALPLPQAIGVHLPSAFMIALAAFCLFRVFQRRGAPLAGLCSAAMFMASRGVEFMFTVRPYAALMAVAALSMLVYDTYRMRRAAGQRATLWPLALVIVFAATIHALTIVYVLAPIAAGELLYWRSTRRLDKRLLLAVVLAATAFVFDFSLARQIQKLYMGPIPLSARTPGLPTRAKLLELLTLPMERRWQMFLFAAVLTLTVALWRRSHSKSPSDLPRDADLLYPLLSAVAIYAAAVLAFVMGVVNHYFFTRYASPVFISGALLLGVILSTLPWRKHPFMPLVVTVVLLLLPWLKLRHSFQEGANISPQQELAGLFQHGDIVASPLSFPSLWWYATPVEREHMLVLTDPVRSLVLADGIPEAVLRQFAAAGVLPFQLTPGDAYRPRTNVYLVQTPFAADTWVPAALQEQGYACVREKGLRSDRFTLQRCTRVQ